MSSAFNIALLGAGLLSLSAGAMAQSSAAPTNGADKSSAMTRTQLQARLEKQFDAADANHDGTLTSQERAAQKSARRDDRREQMFARLDADKNGVISKDEFAAAPGGPDRPDRDARRGNFRPHHAGMFMMHRQLAQYGDKPITKADFVGAGLAMFDRIDTDHDGTISSAERNAARKAMRDRPASTQRPSPPPPGS